MISTNEAPAVTTLEPVSRLEPLRPLPLHDVQRAMTEYQRGLQAVLDDGDWQTFRTRAGKQDKFVKRSGWRKIATMFGLDLELKSVHVERDEYGRILRAEVIGRAIAPNGRRAEDVGACDIAEGGFTKVEHDIRATAATRALNRAISDLVGMGDVSAEEIDTAGPLLPTWAQPVDVEKGGRMVNELGALIGDELAVQFANEAGGRYDGIPNVLAGAIHVLHGLITEQAKTTSEGDTDAV